MIACIGKDDYGLYTLALSVVNFFLIDFGLGDSVSRFLSRFYAEGNREAVPFFLGTVYKVFCIISGFIGLILFLIWVYADALYASLTPEQLGVFKSLFIVVSFYSVVSFPFMPFKGILIANEEFVGLNLCTLLQKVATVVLIIACLFMGLGVFALVAVNAVMAFIFTVVKFLLVRCRTDARADFSSWQPAVAREITAFSVWVMVSQLCQSFIFSIAPSFIAALSSASEVTIFGLAASLEGYVWSVATALNGMFMPRVAQTLGKGAEGLQALMTRVGRLQVYIIGFIVVGLLAIGDRFVDCWVGSGFGELQACALLLISPSLLEVPQLIGDTALVVGENVKSKAKVYIVMAVANVAGMLVLVPCFGALGAAVAIFASYILRTGLLDFLYQRKLGINLRMFFHDAYGGWFIPAAISLVAVRVCSLLTTAHGWLPFVSLGCLLLIVYFCLLYLMAFNDREKVDLKGMIGKIFRRGASR